MVLLVWFSFGYTDLSVFVNIGSQMVSHCNFWFHMVSLSRLVVPVGEFDLRWVSRQWRV